MGAARRWYEGKWRMPHSRRAVRRYSLINSLILLALKAWLRPRAGVVAWWARAGRKAGDAEVAGTYRSSNTNARERKVVSCSLDKVFKILCERTLTGKLKT